MAHERWENVIEGKELSATKTVGEVLEALKTLLDVKAIEINMRNNKFVDKIIAEKTEEEFSVMMPESKLDAYINGNTELRKLSYRTVFHKIYYENIDIAFPYQDLTLQQIGIPLFDVLQVSTDKGLFYVELTKDASLYL